MEKFVVDKVGKDVINPTIMALLETFDVQFNKINQAGSEYEPWQLVLASASVSYLLTKFYYYYIDLDNGLIEHLKKKIFKIARKIPFVQKKIEAELSGTRTNLENDIIASNKGTKFQTHLPTFGLSQEDILNKIQEYSNLGMDWSNGKVSGCVYGGDENVTELVTKVFAKYAWSNPMHADIFPDARKMEAEVVRMACNLFHGDENTCGTMSSGGTESIMLACRAYREIAYSKGIKRPEMVVPQTCHAAFSKACDYFKIKLRLVPVDPVTMKVNPKTMKSYINSNTCMLGASAPNFPNGAIDPIEELSQLALKYNIPLHVDACLGGFLIPFMEDAGYSLPLFDFRLPGVTSISIDTHKYAYTPKGTSIILYRDTSYRRHQFFQCVDWSGGLYASPTFAGSRAGSLIAMTWATLNSYGKDGYINSTREIIKTTKYITEELKKIDNIYLMCEPEVSVIAFNSHDCNILNVFDEMSAKGWHLNAIQNPTGVHIAVTKLHTKPGKAELFVNDMKASVKKVMQSPDKKLGKTAAIYCSAQGVPDKSLIADVAFLFLDACYNTKDKVISK